MSRSRKVNDQWTRLVKLAESRLNEPLIDEAEFWQSVDDRDLFYARELVVAAAQAYVKRLHTRRGD